MDSVIRQMCETIVTQRESRPEIQFWIGCYRAGGHGDWLLLCAFARAAKRHWRKLLGPDAKIGVYTIGSAFGPLDDVDTSHGQPEVDLCHRVLKTSWRAQASAAAPHFDVFYEVQYAVRTSFAHPARFLAEQAEADQRLGYYRELYDGFPNSNRLLGSKYLLSQWDLMSAAAGFPVSPDDLAISTECVEIQGCPPHRVAALLGSAPYVTIHNSEGGRGKTKCLPPDVPPAIVEAVMARGLRVVQVGQRDEKREPIGMGCVDLRGLRMPETARVIAGARLHIDVEGGLVYVAKAVGTLACVFFGPTPFDVFHIPGNAGYSRAVCPRGHCWWQEPDWFTRCPLGCQSCLNLPQPETAAAVALRALDAVEKRGAGVPPASEVARRSAADSLPPADAGDCRRGAAAHDGRQDACPTLIGDPHNPNPPPNTCPTGPTHPTGPTPAPRPDYSQWGEQAIILEFFRGRPPARFLDLGAFNGVTGSNTRALAEDGWSGVCIEADPHRFPELVANMAKFPNVKCLSTAVMPETGMTEFFATGNQCGTCLKENHIRQYVQQSFHVAALSPADLAAQIGDDFQFVSLDIEGMDLPVLKALGPLLRDTELVCIEDSIPNQPFDPVYYQALLDALAVHGFTRIVGRTKPTTLRDASANTLVARGAGAPLDVDRRSAADSLGCRRGAAAHDGSSTEGYHA